MAYASKYYDPVKAHEYYMAHRKLKGRKKGGVTLGTTSTAGLNEEGKVAAKYVKENLTAEKKKLIEAVKEQMNIMIQQLRAELKRMNKYEKKMRKEEYKQKIADLRAKNKEWRTKVKEYYNALYIKELDGLKGVSEYLKSSKK